MSWPLGRALVVLGACALAACAPVRVRQTPAALAQLAAREAQLAPHTHWSLSAHIFVSDGKDNSGSGDLDWDNAAAAFAFTLRAPTGRTWKLRGDAQSATLEGVEAEPIHGTDPARLLRDKLGWNVPVADLSSWVRGMRAAGGGATVLYDDRNRPAVLDQDGWHIEYKDWFDDREPPMPRRVFASRGAARVKLAIDRWTFDD